MINQIEIAIRTALIDGTAGPLVSDRIYNELAPESASLPYIVLMWNAGGMVNSDPTEQGDTRHMVKVISSSGAEAATIANAIKADLHEADLSLDAPWSGIRCQCLNAVKFVELEERAQYHHNGWIVRVRVSQ